MRTNLGKKLHNNHFNYPWEKWVVPYIFFLSIAISAGVMVSAKTLDRITPLVQAKDEGATVLFTLDTAPVPSPKPSPKPVVISETDRIKNLIRETFGDNGELAIAIGMSESHLIPTNTLFASKGAHSWSSATYKGECSVGLFMVNLASDNCEGKRVHYDKVPGNTLQEKISWLKVPENNIRFAKKLFDERGNFTAWSGFTGGGYLKYMEE